MADRKHLFLVTSLMTLLASQAFADVTPEQVWKDIQSKVEHGGFELSVSDTQRDDATLIQRETVARMGDELSNVTLFLGNLSFRDLGDGRVAIRMHDPIRASYWDAGLQENLKADLEVDSDGLEVIASGSPEEITYKYSSDSTRVSIDGTYGGFSDIAFKGTVEMSGLHGLLFAAKSDTEALFISNIHSDDISADFNATEELPLQVFHYSGQGNLQDFDLNEKLFADHEAMEKLQQNGSGTPANIFDLDFKEEASYASSRWTFKMGTEEPSQEITVSAGSGPSKSQMTINREGFSAKLQTETIHVEGEAVPAVIPSSSMSIDGISFKFAAPLPSLEDASSSTGDVDVNLLLSGLAFNDDLWSAVDPLGTLDHGPMSLEIDADARIEMSPFATDPATPLLMPKSVKLDSFAFKGLGVDMGASGGVSVTAPGEPMTGMMPVLDGEFNLHASGIDDLLDAFSKAGMVDGQNLQMFAFMLDVFTRVDEDGMRKAKITYADDGAMYVNGEIFK
jgi:hypothetical protein